MRLPHASGWIVLLIVTALAHTAAAFERSQLAPSKTSSDLPEELVGVGVTEKLDQPIPLKLSFKDTDGKIVRLDQICDGSLPVILTLNYTDCPLLCSLQLNGVIEAMKDIDGLGLGRDYRMLTVSIDPKETPEKAYDTRKMYLQRYGRPGAGKGYYYLTTPRNDDIQQLADSVGFGYRLHPKTGEYLHTAVTMVLTPQGKVSRYLYGVKYDPRTLELALVEAGKGKIGKTLDRVILYCFVYDSESNGYAPAAFRLIQVGGVLTLLVMGASLGAFWIRESRKNSKQTGAGKDDAPTGTSPTDSHERNSR